MQKDFHPTLSPYLILLRSISVVILSLSCRNMALKLILGLLVVVTSPPALIAIEHHEDLELQSIVVSDYPIRPSDNNSSSKEPSDAGINIDCSSPTTKSRLIGGVESNIEDFPYIVALTGTLQNKTELFCSGSLISDQWVLTSAHCPYLASFVGLLTEDESLSYVTVILGDKSVFSNNNTSSARQTFKVSKFIYNRLFTKGPNAQSKRFDNNIGLVKLDRPVQRGAAANVRPVCLSDKAPVLGTQGVVSGWSEEESLLHNVTLTLISNEECMKALNGTGDEDELTENLICAGGRDLGKGPCVQDFGGPLVSVKPSAGYQIGVVAWTPGEESCGEPAFYTRVDKYFDWIVRNVNKY